MLIRPARSSDAEAIRAIYNAEVEGSTHTLDLVPRTLDEQLAYLEARSGGLVVLVAELAAEVVGFASLSFYRDRPGYRTSVEDSIYIARSYHGRGLGSALLGSLVDAAERHGFHTMFARIVGPQPASVALHERHGFTLVGVERQVARKFGRWHDVAVLQRMLGPTEGPPATGVDTR